MAVQGLRVTHVVTRNHRRGAENVAVNLSVALEDHHVDNQLLALFDGPRGQELPNARSLGGRGRLGWLRTVLRLRRAVTASRPDVIIAHGGAAAFAAVAAFPFDAAVPIVWQRILELPPGATSRWQRLPWVVLSRRVAAAVVITAHVEEEVRGFGFEGPIVRVPNHRPYARFGSIDRARASARLRDELAIGSEPIVGFASHLFDQKRPERFIDVAEQITRDGSDAVFVMAGSGPLHASMAAQIEVRGLAKRVVMLGHREDVDELLGAFDVLLLTSESETMPGVLVEAQMTGCPVVSYPVDGADEAVMSGVSGVVLDRGDTKVMADVVSSLLGDPGRLVAMSQSARLHARQFATEVVVEQYRALFESLCVRDLRLVS